VSRPSWERVKPIVADALEMDTGERVAFLERSCGEDAELRAEVESLLAAAASDVDSLPGAQAISRIAGGALRQIEHDATDGALRSLLETALGQQYELLRPLGRGGMGAVYLARDTALERLVAIKVLRPDLAALEEGRERFRREARVIARLSHPSILPLYTFGEVHGTLYLVMAYVPGVTLADRLRVEGRLSPEEATRILSELADALARAHREGVIHRDIKPANILLDDATGHAILADFGIAKIEGAGDPITSTGMVLGTPDYMSPEQVAGAAVDERSDIYSLGAVGYTMLTGHPPTSTHPFDAPPELHRLITRAIARDPDKRWPNATALADALSAIHQGAQRAPEPVRDLPAFGAYAALWAMAWIAMSLTLRPSGDRALLLLIAMLVPLGLVLHVGNKVRSGVGPREMARIAFWPPEWWGMWWPRALRRPGDVWARLPRPARLIREVLSVFTIVLPVLVLIGNPLERLLPEHTHDVVSNVFDILEVGLVAAAGAATIAAIAWARRRQLSWGERVRLLFGPTAASPDWETPGLARLLSGGLSSIREPAADSAGDHLRAIVELSPRLGDVGRRAASVATHLTTAIRACESEEAQLARETSTEEIDRLGARVASLDGAHPAEGSDEAELLALLRRQLELVRAMRVRSVLSAQRRTRLLSLLHSLWTGLRDGDADRSSQLVTEIEKALA
jgi:serine/threonine-protein kinase